jgi:hypothetical protein
VLKDFIGRELNVGDVIAFSDNISNKMIMAKIDSFTTHQCVCTILFGHDHVKTVSCYAQQSVKLDLSEVSMYLLKFNHKDQK